MSQLFLSKSKYMVGLQCPKLLWVHYNDKQRLPAVDPATQARFDQGHQVGELAKRLFPDGVEIDWDVRLEEVLVRSREALDLRRPLFEAGFKHENAYCRADLLVPAGRKEWDLIEVKSSTRVKQQHLEDVAFQWYVYDRSAVPIRRCFVMHLDSSYIRDGEVDPEKLLVKEDVTEETRGLLGDVRPTILQMLATIKKKECPQVDLVEDCPDPRGCDLAGLCWSFLPDHSVLTLTNGRDKPRQLMRRAIFGLADIPDDVQLSDKQRIQVTCARTGEAHVDRQELKAFLDRLMYPLYFLDFETIGVGVPIYDRSSPYEPVPFQYSLHVQRRATEEVEHHAFLSDGREDPRPLILARLESELGQGGSIVVYNQAFESRCLKQSAERYPQYMGWVESILPRFVDLLAPFRSFHYHHPDQQGSASLKVVMPALTGRSYDDMEIADGETASLRFLEMALADLPSDERTAIARDLEAYCGQDTEGMIEMIEELRRLCG